MEILYFVWEVGWSIDKLLFKITLKYLDLDDVDGVTRKVLSNLILKAYKNFISVNSSK